jgi:cytochrome c oxidase subunit 2
MGTEEVVIQTRELAVVEVIDAEGAVLHTWMHIPEGHIFSSALSEDMILPCDEDVVFEMHSKPSDDSNPNYVGVQHSFWLPEWGVKEDLVPGLEGGTYMTIMADDPGTFPIRCAEYCGNQHSMMYGQVKIVAAEGTDCSIDTGVKKTSDGESSGGGY